MMNLLKSEKTILLVQDSICVCSTLSALIVASCLSPRGPDLNFQVCLNVYCVDLGGNHIAVLYTDQGMCF